MLNTGSIEEIATRLLIWGKRAPKGLARVEFDSEFARILVLNRLRNGLAEDGIPFHEITLTAGKPAATLVRDLVEQLNSLERGVVSINGFATAFSYDGNLESALRILNFNRENLAQSHLRQIWWMPTHFVEEFVNAAPDLNSWFIVRSHLTETVAPSDFESIIAQPKAITANISNARKRAKTLEDRFEEAINAGVPLDELRRNLVIPAINVLREAGAEREARALSAKLNKRIAELRKQKYPTRVFISYSHESPEHMKQVLELSNRLRADGVDCYIDQYEVLPSAGWERWAVSQIENAEYVLVACTEGYMGQLRGDQALSEDLIVNWGGAVVTPELYETQASQTFFIPVVLSPPGKTFVPDFLRSATRYNLSEPEGYDRLYRRITDNPKFLRLDSNEANPIEPRQDFFKPSNIPYRRNRFFTGRDKILWTLRRTFDSGSVIALTQTLSISGLGGIGKTQTAVEYAYRYCDKYKALLWARADSREALVSDFTAIATLLNLVEINAPDQNITTSAVTKWLASSGDWLLVLDNADDPQIVREFLPRIFDGHILLTSRAQTLDDLEITSRVQETLMSVDEAVEFILRRAGQHDYGALGREPVIELTNELGYLPLALEQAGAYLAKEKWGIKDYLLSYRCRWLDLLKESGPERTGKYPASVRTTLSLSFEQVKQSSIDAATILQISAFLNPDRIPLELLSIGALELGPEFFPLLSKGDFGPLDLDGVLKPLIEYSLIYHNADMQTYDIHRLVQAVIRDVMDTNSQRQWAEKAIRIVNRAFPSFVSAELNECERLITQIESCARLIDEWKFDSSDAASLLNKAGDYLSNRGRFREAAILYQRSLRIIEILLGPDHPDVATRLTSLASLYQSQGKYAEAELLLMRALRIREKTLESYHPDVAISIINLANLYQSQHRYAEAEPLYYRTLNINEKSLGAEHPAVAISLNNLANLYREQGKYAEAEQLYLRSLAILEKTSGPDHPDVAIILNNLARLYEYEGKHREAEQLYLRSLGIIEKTSGSDYLIQSLANKEKSLGAEHPAVAISLNNLANLYREQGKYAEAEQLYLRSLAILEKTSGPDHPDVAAGLNNLALLYMNQKKYYKADPLFRRSLAIYRKAFGNEHPDVAAIMKLYSTLLRNMNRKGEAQRLEAQAKKIQKKYNRGKRRSPLPAGT